NRLIDYALGNGPLLLGHSPRPVLDAVRRELRRGLLYAAQSELEAQVAELLQEHVPCAELARFCQSGTEGIPLALRLTRAATGRTRILKFQGHYHGWADEITFNTWPTLPGGPAISDPSNACLIPTTPASRGLRPGSAADVLVTTWNDPAALEAVFARHGSELAAVIMEPVMGNTGVITPRPGYLERARELCTKHGTVLIFDEIITGFRVGLRGAQGLYGVTPDLAVFAKALASGFPLAAVTGRAELFDGIGDGTVLHGGTFNGYPVGMAAALATLRTLADPASGVYEAVEARGRQLMDGFRAMAASSPLPLLVGGLPAMSFVAFTDQPELVDHRDVARLDQAVPKRFGALLAERGVRAHGRGLWLMSAAHSERDIEQTLEASADAIHLIAASGAG
ncbi:MAG: aminotransferase class III-fold pyridoxal phosphate-dependent enzyme, partial [Chloroflexi bacterium]|nr:aminotransferase class III-fold pyridoxal phosphate-dependent enzyme [Chloroflexota bacterium]